MFEFDMMQTVSPTEGRVWEGTVHGRSEFSNYTKRQNQYMIKYTDNDGNSVYNWFDEVDLKHAE